MRSFTLSLCLFITHIHLAQEREYMVTKNKDTIYGSIKRSFNLFDKDIVFKLEDATGKKTRIDVNEIKCLRLFDGVDGNSYIVTIYDTWFLKRIVEGEIEVFEMLSTPLFYVSKNGSELEFIDMGMPFARKKAHAQLRPYFIDNPELLEEFDSMQGTEKNILYIIKKYNSLKENKVN
ncbi:MAG: hypothetical protein ACK5M1_14165 [Xanthomarina gelatinilytica]|uniref:hypothetical protein n=1 Tax=Xanthomarina gelatinilytica TaxID=1137281 RepID=UPI003A878512